MVFAGLDYMPPFSETPSSTENSVGCVGCVGKPMKPAIFSRRYSRRYFSCVVGTPWSKAYPSTFLISIKLAKLAMAGEARETVT